MSHIRKRTQKYSHKVSMMIFCELILKGAKKLFFGLLCIFFLRWTLDGPQKNFSMNFVVLYATAVDSIIIQFQMKLRSHTKKASKKYP